MSEDVQIQLVRIEFLRPGPPHNQLLSPLTQYVTVCGDAGGGVVTVPYEHGQLERLLKELPSQDPQDRQSMLHDLGMAMGRFLGGVPGLPGALMVDLNQFVHLRLTFSASELALLPFEVAKVPVMASEPGESWLSVQTHPPVCLTRNIRTVSPEDVVWPNRPRILFISGNPEEVPYEEHRRVLLKAIERFQYPDRADQKSEPRRDQFGDVLTILVNPTLKEIFQECQHTLYTHIHVLTYGDLNGSSPGLYGLVFRGQNGALDVVSDDRFRIAITSIHHRPTVVTVASCDRCNIGTGFVSGASLAHELHQAGIPLVVAAHFPLSIEGSVLLTARLYSGLLLGEHPLLLLQQARAELYATYAANWHDWASLVVYEALPSRLKFRTESEQVVLEQWLDGADVSNLLSGIAEHAVLILGRFTDERKAVLDAIKRALENSPRRYQPLLFDFEKPSGRDLIESIVRFASVSRFVVADLSDPKSIPAELQAIVPQFPSLPVVPIIEASQREYSVADNVLRRESVVKPVVKYRDRAHLLDVLEKQVLEPAERLYAKLNPQK